MTTGKVPKIPPEFRKFHDYMCRKFFATDSTARWRLFRAWKRMQHQEHAEALEEFYWLRNHVRHWHASALRQEALSLLEAAIRSIQKSSRQGLKPKN